MMRDYPSITKSNLPKETTAFDMAQARANSELSGLDEALQAVGQLQEYKGGQLDMFSDELIEHSSLFLSVLEETNDKSK